MDDDWFVRNITIVIGVLDAILSFLSSLGLLCILALLLAPLDEDVAEQDKAAATNDRTNDDSALRAASHVVTAIAVAVAITARPAAGAESSAASASLKLAQLGNQPELISIFFIFHRFRREIRVWIVFVRPFRV
jgi:hypothetical protein